MKSSYFPKHETFLSDVVDKAYGCTAVFLISSPTHETMQYDQSGQSHLCLPNYCWEITLFSMESILHRLQILSQVKFYLENWVRDQKHMRVSLSLSLSSSPTPQRQQDFRINLKWVLISLELIASPPTEHEQCALDRCF